MLARRRPTPVFGAAATLAIGALIVAALGLACAVLMLILRDALEVGLGQDFWFYRAIGERWLDSGTVYHPHQLSGPYQLQLMVDVLYPPIALLVFVPLALLPAPVAVAAWWGIPLGLILVLLRRFRPSPLGWLGIAVLLAWPRTTGSLVFGNSDMAVAGAVAGGLLSGWPAVIVLLKPTFAPLALVGIRHPAFWIAVAALVLISLAALPAWEDYFRVLRDVRGLNWDYSLANLPIALIPVAAWATRRDRPIGQHRERVRALTRRIA